MSFLGSIAGPLRKVLAAYADEISVPVLLPCAGNFTVGAALRSGGYQGRITGCDITLYTSALGAYLAGDHLHVTEREDCPEHLRGFLDLSDPAHLAASVSIMLERMLAASVSWEAPAYTEISFKDVEIYERITAFREWMIIMERPLPEIEKLLGEPVAVVHKGRKSITCAYAGHSRKTIVTRSYMASRSPGPIFPSDRKLTGDEEPGIVLLSHEQTVRLNELFMAARVDYILANIVLSVAFCLDRKIIGKADFKQGKAYEDWGLPEPGRQIYQQSDLAVPSEAEPRLSKLVLMFVQSHEVKRLLQEKVPEDWTWAVTTAFSRHPVSMKYRGIYKLHKRLDGSEHGGYRLNYYGRLGKWSLAEAYAEWLKKFHN